MRFFVKEVKEMWSMILPGIIPLCIGVSILLGISMQSTISDAFVVISDIVVKHAAHLMAIVFVGWFLSPFVLDHARVEEYTKRNWIAFRAKQRFQIIGILILTYGFWNFSIT